MNRRTFLRSLGLGLLIGPHLVRHTTHEAPAPGRVPADEMDAIIDALNRTHAQAVCNPKTGEVVITLTQGHNASTGLGRASAGV